MMSVIFCDLFFYKLHVTYFLYENIKLFHLNTTHRNYFHSLTLPNIGARGLIQIA